VFNDFNEAGLLLTDLLTSIFLHYYRRYMEHSERFLFETTIVFDSRHSNPIDPFRIGSILYHSGTVWLVY